jgi:hypothetical protein
MCVLFGRREAEADLDLHAQVPVTPFDNGKAIDQMEVAYSTPLRRMARSIRGW